MQSNFFYTALVLILAYKQWIAVHTLAGTAFGVWLLVSCIGTTLILTSWIFIFKKTKQIVFLLLCDLIISTIIYIDVLHFRQFRELPLISSLILLKELWQVQSSLRIIVNSHDLIYFLDFAILFVCTLILSKKFKEKYFLKKLKSAATFLLIGIIFFFFAYFQSAKILKDKEYLGHSWTAKHLGLIAFHIKDISKFLINAIYKFESNHESVKAVQEWFSDKKLNSQQSRVLDPRKKKNVIIIQVESLQNFVIDRTVLGQELTPNLNKLIKGSFYFPNSFAQIGRGGTADANLLANCSLLPLQDKVTYIDYVNNDFLCLPQILQSYGYSTAAYQAVAPDFYNFSAGYHKIGYERFLSKGDFVSDNLIGYVLADESQLLQTAKILLQTEAPFLSFITTMTSHTPFEVKDLPHELRLGVLENTVLGGYFHSIHYVDKSLGKFIDALKQNDALKDTILVIFGDHAGVHRGNSNIVDFLPINPDNEFEWQKIERGIPIIIYDSDNSLIGRREGLAGQVDIAPTILELLGLQEANNFFIGQSLLSNEPNSVVFSDGSIIGEKFMYLSENIANPANCYFSKTGKSEILESCGKIMNEGEVALKISRSIIEDDLIGKIRKN